MQSRHVLLAMGCGMLQRIAAFAKKMLGGGLVTMTLLGVVTGCQQTFLAKEVYEQAHAQRLPNKLENDHCGINQPMTGITPAPATVTNPDRPPRYLTLQGAFALALENGHVSSRAGSGRGLVDDNLATFNGPGSLNSQTERIRVLAMNPAINYAITEGALARFDAQYVTSMSWSNTDNLQQGLSSFNNGHSAALASTLIKPFATGGVANVSFLANYTNLNNPPTGVNSVLNPNYTLRTSVGFEQPLWKDWGVDVNQLLPRFPGISGSSFNSSNAAAAFNTHQGTVSSQANFNSEGILISRLRFDQARAEFERNVNTLILNTEVAYWNLYNKFGQLYSFEENLRVMHKTWQESYNLYKAGSEKMPPPQYFQVLGQYEEFRAERLRALNEVLDAERHLRGILGLPVEDGTKIVPITPPSFAELKPDWQNCMQDALNLRPELILARENLKYHQYLLSIQKNNLRPDLRAFARYEPVGFGSTLVGDGNFIDGSNTPRTSNAVRSLIGSHYGDWTMGVNFSVPLGQRFEHAAIRAARLQLTQAFHFLRDQEERASRFLASQIQELDHQYHRIEAHRAERMAYLESVRKNLQQSKGGKLSPGDQRILDAQRRYASALVKEYTAIAEYNSTLARLEWAKGTILKYNNVHISEGPLPECAQVRAVEYEKERSKAIVLRERPDSLTQPGRLCAVKSSEVLTSGNNETEKEPAPAAPPLAPATDFEQREAIPIIPKRLGFGSKTLTAPKAMGTSWTPGKEGNSITPIPQIEKRIEAPQTMTPVTQPGNPGFMLVEPEGTPALPTIQTAPASLPSVLDRPSGATLPPVNLLPTTPPIEP